MGESSEQKIQRWLREGLDLYGVDEVSAAIVTWKKVLELDPVNAEALDYIRNADRRRVPRSEKGAGRSATRAALVQEAQVLMRQGEIAAAFDLLSGASGAEVRGLDYEALLDLARSRLYVLYCERVGDLERVPRPSGDPSALTRFNLPPDAGFVLSMVDGRTSIEDLISLSGMDALDALHTMNGLIEAGLVEMAR